MQRLPLKFRAERHRLHSCTELSSVRWFFLPFCVSIICLVIRLVIFFWYAFDLVMNYSTAFLFRILLSCVRESRYLVRDCASIVLFPSLLLVGIARCARPAFWKVLVFSARSLVVQSGFLAGLYMYTASRRGFISWQWFCSWA